MTLTYPHLLVTETHSRWGATSTDRISMYMLAYRPSAEADMVPITSGAWDKIHQVMDHYIERWAVPAYHWDRGSLTTLKEAPS